MASWRQGYPLFKICGSNSRKETLFNPVREGLPDWLLCHYCTRFHPVTPDDGPEKRWRYLNEPECIRANGVICLFIGFEIKYQHVQLLMNNYRFGRAYQTNLEKLCHKISYTIGNAKIETNIWSCIVLGELRMRVNSKLRLTSPADIDLVKYLVPEICPHLRSFGQRRYVLQNIFCQPCHAGKLTCVECSKPRSCQKCSTWVHVSGKEFGNQGTEIQIDIWRHLGSCETPFNAKWSSQKCRLYPPLHIKSARPRERGRMTVHISSYGIAW